VNIWKQLTEKDKRYAGCRACSHAYSNILHAEHEHWACDFQDNPHHPYTPLHSLFWSSLDPHGSIYIVWGFRRRKYEISVGCGKVKCKYGDVLFIGCFYPCLRLLLTALWNQHTKQLMISAPKTSYKYSNKDLSRLQLCTG